MNKFGEFIRNQRFKNGWTAAQLASKIGITSVQLSNIEKGKCLPRIGSVEKYAKALDLNLADLTDVWIEDYESRK